VRVWALRYPQGLGKGTKVVAHEGMGTSTGIFYKSGYGDGQCSTLPIVILKRRPPILNETHIFLILIRILKCNDIELLIDD